MVSRLKQEHDQIDARIRDRQSFGTSGNRSSSRESGSDGKASQGGS